MCGPWPGPLMGHFSTVLLFINNYLHKKKISHFYGCCNDGFVKILVKL